MPHLTGIYGASGCGRGIMPLARQMPQLASEHLVFIDDSPDASKIVNGHAVMSFREFCGAPAVSKQVAIAIASPTIRSFVVNKIDESGIPLLSVWANTSIVMDDVEVGEGALVSPFVTFTSNIRVGRCFHANLYSYIEHDCIIGDFVTFAPGVHCNGSVNIGDFAYIGAGAMIRQGVSIGTHAVIGMGAVVVKDVPAGTTVVGNPSRTLLRK